jgi:hypothetical protein
VATERLGDRVDMLPVHGSLAFRRDAGWRRCCRGSTSMPRTNAGGVFRTARRCLGPGRR